MLKDAAACRKRHPGPEEHPASWGHAFRQPVTDPLWWATAIFAIGTAFGSLYATYAGNPAWGAGGFSDYSALIGAGFAAIGGHTVISALTPAS